MIKLHPGQYKVLKDKSHKKLVIVGARWGKTYLSMLTAIKKCIETPSKHVQYYVGDHPSVRRVSCGIAKILDEHDIEYKSHYNQITFPNGSLILINVPMKGDIIFDDAFKNQDVMMIFTPLGWTLHNAPTTENPEVELPDDLRKTYSEKFGSSMFDGKINS